MLESGIIMCINDKTMTVEFQRTEMCAKCGACSHGQKQAMLMEVQRIGDAAIGDTVQVELPERTIMRASLILYGIPLVLLMAGLLLGAHLAQSLGLPGNPDHYAALLGLGLAGISFLAIHLTERRRGESGRYAPRVVNIEKACPIAGQKQNNDR